MGLLLVFFPEEDAVIHKNKPTTDPHSPSTSSSSPFFIKHTIKALFRRSNSTHLLSRAQSTISICALLIFLTLLLFSLSTFEPKKHLTIFRRNSDQTKLQFPNPNRPPPRALQGMGKLYRRGTKSMTDLTVAHVSESVTRQDLVLFLRLLHRSGLTSRSDLVLLFPSSPAISDFDSAVRDENESFANLIYQHTINFNGTSNIVSGSGFDPTQFVKSGRRELQAGEPVWGRRIRRLAGEDHSTESTRLSYGSVVGFEVDELDPENSLAGFMDHVPMSLRRWANYPMLLGRLRRNFKHVMLIDVNDLLVIRDPLGLVRNLSPESVLLCANPTQSASKHSRKNLDKTPGHRQNQVVSPSIIMGGTRGVRRLSATMLTEIAREAMQHRKKKLVSESGLVNQLVGSEFLLKNVGVVISSESIAELSSFSGWSLNSGSSLSLSSLSYIVARRGNSNSEDLHAGIMKHICSFPPDSSAYSDCK